MKQTLRSVCLVTSGYRKKNLRLQPWRYLSEIAGQLAELGHPVTVITDGEPDLTMDPNGQVKVIRLHSVALSGWGRNKQFHDAFSITQTEIALWHVGLTSFLRLLIPLEPSRHNIGIFTSPLYSIHDLLRPGMRVLLNDLSSSATHLTGALIPRWLLRRSVALSGLQELVVQSQTLRRQIQELKLKLNSIKVIPPGIDSIWIDKQACENLQDSCGQMGLLKNGTTILYYGEPTSVRGLYTLLKAFEIAQQLNPALKLIILSRRRKNELHCDFTRLEAQISTLHAKERVKVVDGFLAPKEVLDFLTACDVVALPFELVPSDSPLSLLEAAALGKPVVTTRLGCLPEMIPLEQCFLSTPGDPASLARAILAAAGYRASARAGAGFNRSWKDVGKEWSDYIQGLL